MKQVESPKHAIYIDNVTQMTVNTFAARCGSHPALTHTLSVDASSICSTVVSAPDAFIDVNGTRWSFKSARAHHNLMSQQ